MNLNDAAKILTGSGFIITEIDDKDHWDDDSEKVCALINENTEYFYALSDDDSGHEVGIKGKRVKNSDDLVQVVSSLMLSRQRLEVVITKLDCLWELCEMKRNAMKLVEEFEFGDIKDIFKDDNLWCDDIDRVISDIEKG